LFGIVSDLSRWAIPVVLLLVPLIAMIRGVNVFEKFVEGAEDGFATAIKTIPFLVAYLNCVCGYLRSGWFAAPLLPFLSCGPDWPGGPVTF